MKPFWAIVGGFVVSAGMFIAGVAFAMAILAVEPAQRPGPASDVAELWSAQPRPVNTSAQQLQRVPARSDSGEADVAVDEAVAETDDALQSHDMTTTASVTPETPEEPERPAHLNELSVAHLQWCSERYRSYRPADNSYTAYSGRKRPCHSPYWKELAAATERLSTTDADVESYAWAATDEAAILLQHVSDYSSEGATMTPEHVRDCFRRYRSYRPEDNTYQPYGGGPRRQCR